MYRVMGSHNAIVSWVKQNLGGPDYIHFTRAGAARIGELLYNAIKLHYDYYLFRVSHGIDSGKLNEIHAFADSSKNEFDTLVTQNDTLVLTPIENAPEDDDFGSVTEESEVKE
jgi:hypothetical protein